MRTDHPRDCILCWNDEEHAVLDYKPMSNSDLFSAIQRAAYLMGNTHAAVVSTSAWAALSRDLNALALIADDRYQAARKAGR